MKSIPVLFEDNPYKIIGKAYIDCGRLKIELIDGYENHQLYLGGLYKLKGNDNTYHCVSISASKRPVKLKD